MQVWVIPGARDMKLCCATLGAAVDVCQLVDSAERFINVSKSVHDFVLKTLRSSGAQVYGMEPDNLGGIT